MLQSGRQNQKWPISGQIDYITRAVGGSPMLWSGGKNQKWPTSGKIRNITLAAWGVPNASLWGRISQVAHKWGNWLYKPQRQRGSHRLVMTKSAVAHKWADWLHEPLLSGGGGVPQRFTAGDKIRKCPQVGRLAT